MVTGLVGFMFYAKSDVSLWSRFEFIFYINIMSFMYLMFMYVCVPLCCKTTFHLETTKWKLHIALWFIWMISSHLLITNIMGTLLVSTHQVYLHLHHRHRCLRLHQWCNRSLSPLYSHSVAPPLHQTSWPAHCCYLSMATLHTLNKEHRYEWTSTDKVVHSHELK